ncbi:MAG: N-acetyltransferase family protein [Rhodomicrobium sp.]|jgi:phosphinothricin acetyltransferase
MMRKSTPEDIERITGIYNEAIEEGGFTGDLEPLSLENRRAWYAEHKDRYSIYVKVIDGSIVGYVALSPYRKGRKAFDGTCEMSYYLDRKFRARGHGAEMVGYAIENAREAGFRLIVAIVLATNRRSIDLLGKFDFVVSGMLPQAAEINGQTIDHWYFHRLLSGSKDG